MSHDKQPRVSILLSVYNAAHVLQVALDSLLAQTETDWECIAISDGSSDSSAAILRDYAKRDARFHVFDSSLNLGLTVRLNEALRLAKGKYIARQDADDWSFPERIKRQADFLDQHSNVGLVGCAFQVVNVNGEALSVSRPATAPFFLKNQLKHRNPLAHGSLLMRADLLRAIGGYRTEFRMAQDYDMIKRMAAKTNIFALSEILYSLRLAPRGTSLHAHEQQMRFAADAGKTAGNAVKFLERKSDPELSDQRYKYLEALHLIKAGRAREGRACLNMCIRPEISNQVQKLRVFSYLPMPLRLFMMSVKRLLEMLS